MRKQLPNIDRRRFFKSSLAASTAIVAPMVIPGSALGLDGTIPPSERVNVAGIGLGRRGTRDLGFFLEQSDVNFLAICDIKAKQRAAIKQIVDRHHGNSDCDTYQDFRDLLARDEIDAVLIATGPNWHATMSAYAAKAGKDVYCEKPVTKNIAQSLLLRDIMRRSARIFQAGTQRRNLPNFAFACELARTGKLGKLRRVHAHPGGMYAMTSGWLPAQQAPDANVVDWDMYLGPAAWRPFNQKQMRGSSFEKGGGLVGGGVLEWGSHCVDLCQWAVGDCAPPIEYQPKRDEQMVARYESGVELVLRERDWLPLGTCPVRFEGDQGWIETGDSGKLVASSAELLAGRNNTGYLGAPARYHARDFLDSVKDRSQPKSNPVAMCNAHIACHAANIALYLDRPVRFDNLTSTFIDDPEANRLRSEAIREPWRV